MKPRDFAKELRQRDVPVETLLWEELRGRRCGGYKFVRQQPIAGYVVDFLCRRSKLIVEIDGPSHEGREDYDKARTRDLARCGYQLIRFSNGDIYDGLADTVETIFQNLEMANGRGALTPSSALRAPSPSREMGNVV